MAYNQNAFPNSLRPIQIARTAGEEPRIVAPVTQPNSNPLPHEVCTGSPVTIPVYYPSSAPAVPDAPFVGFNHVNVVPAMTNWLPRMPPPATAAATAGVGLVPGYTYNNTTIPPRGYDANLASLGGGDGGSNAADHASNEGGDGSASGRKKVKFLCSFGGKILPRPSDGILRYVGGDTRIISVRRDVGFNELIQKMFDMYGRDIVIKYQLPEEDLDALVTISRPDDLENMMEEYDKLVERSADGSTKLRVFLFSEHESCNVIRFKDLQDSGQKYVEAVNGIIDGFGSGGGGGDGGSGIGRKESIASASSTQNSEVSGTEGGGGGGVDSVGHDQGEVIGPSSVGVLSPGGSGGSSAGGVPATKPVLVPASPSQSDHEMEILERSVPVYVQQQRQLGNDLQSPGATIPPPATYVDPRQGTFNRTEYVQVGFQPQIMGTVGPMYTQPQLHDNVIGVGMPPHQLNPSMHISFRPNPSPSPVTVMDPQLVQQQEVQMVHFPDERMFGQRVVHLSSNQSYTTYQPQPQVSPPVIPGHYGWNQVQSQQMIYTDPVTRFDGCIMCQKALPHAHSDIVTHERKESPKSTVSDVNPVYQSLGLEDTRRMMQPNSYLGHVEHETGGVMPPLYAVHGQRVETSDPAMVSTPYGVFLQQVPYAKQEMVVNKRISGDSNSLGVLSPISDSQVHESPREYPGNFPLIVPKDDNVEPGFTYDNMRQIDSRMEDLCIRPSDNILVGNDVRVENLETPVSKLQLVMEGSPAFSDSALVTEGTPPVNEWNVYPLQSESKSDMESVLMDSLNPFKGVGETQENVNPLFCNQDPWILQHDSHFPSPQTKNSGESPSGNMPMDDGAYQPNVNLDLNYGPSNIGSAEELIKQDLQAVAEGVAGSVHPDSNRHGMSEHCSETKQSGESHKSNADVQTVLEVEDLKTKNPEKTNIGFPVSDCLGRLQIIKNSDLEELRELGSGTFGTVYHGKWRGSDVAIKRINDRCFVGKASEQERMREDFWNEAIKLADLHHPNVMAFYGVVLDGPGGSVATVTEFMVNGSLRNALQKNERNLDKRKRLLIAMDVAFGMEYLHGKNIVHFDLKSDNLLVNLRDPHRPICKVGDLGLSKVKRQTLISGGVRGTLPWMAPELLNGSSSLVSEKVDVFSFGIVMWELLTGDEPYADLHYGAIIGGIVSNTLRPAVPESCDPDWRCLMEGCWCAEPSERPSFTEIANQLRTITSKVPPKAQPYQ